jgi:hypothetical protein
MPNREALGRTVNVVPIAASRGLSLQGAGGLTFVCTGNDTFTITVASSFGGSYATPGSIITKKYTNTATNGTAAWVEATQSASNAVTISSGTVAFYVGEDQLPDGKTYVKVTPSSAGLVTAIYSDLDAQRTPANLAIPSA